MTGLPQRGHGPNDSVFRFLACTWSCRTAICASAGMPAARSRNSVSISAASVCPCSTSERRRSMSAVNATSLSFGATTSIRDRPCSVERSCLPLRSTYPVRISFSITSARVAGVPMPPEWDSSSSRAALRSLSSTQRLACSIAASSVASVNGFGGFVFPSDSVAPPCGTGAMETPSVRFAGMMLPTASSSSPWSSCGAACSMACQPRETGWSERLVKRHSLSGRSRPSSGCFSHQCGSMFATTFVTSCT